MIISASRRTDIPAFYSRWFMNRIRAGYCEVPNPFNPAQVSRVSLQPEDVEVIAFWTRNAAPLLSHLQELDARGYRYYFLYTVLDYPQLLEPHKTELETRIETVQQLAVRIGPDRVIWRYDPIVLSTITSLGFHQEVFARIASNLEGTTTRCIISFVDLYRKLSKRLHWLEEHGCTIREPYADEATKLAAFMAAAAQSYGITVTSCAEMFDLTASAVSPGSCIDGAYIAATFGIAVSLVKDPSQRPACRCAVSRDIGCYDTCVHGCRYCYATSSASQARARLAGHDPEGPSMTSGGQRASGA